VITDQHMLIFESFKAGAQTHGPRCFSGIFRYLILRCRVSWKKMPWNKWTKVEWCPVRFSSWP